MKGNKKYIVVLFAIGVIILICGVAFFIKRNTESKATRYEWMEMLCEQNGMTEYQNEESYYTDVDAENPYFSCIQSAVEWDVLDSDTEFGGESYVIGRFAALTAMRAIGEKKLKIYLGTDDKITDDIYVELAVEHELIEEKQLTKELSIEECEQILESFKKLYFGEFWKDDYASIVYQEGIIELSAEDVLESNAECSEMIVADGISRSLEMGNIIVFEQNTTKLKIAREITEVNPDGTLSLSAVELDKVVKELTVSDITELTFDDIVNYYGLEKNINEANHLNYRQTGVNVMNMSVFSAGVKSKGYKFLISTVGEGKERHVEVVLTNNDNGVSHTLPINDKVEEDDEYSSEIDIDKLYIGGQASYSVGSGLKYAEAAVDAHATFKNMVNAEKDKRFLLCKIPIPIGNGMVGADIQVYLVLSVEGGISFEAEMPVEASVLYEKGKGLRSPKHAISVEEPAVEANCDASAMLGIEPIFSILGCRNVMDVEAEIGVSASAEIITHPNEQICADVSAAYPVMTILVSGDDDADTMIGKLGISAEWEIISPENALKQIGIHYERLPDDKKQFVEKCTYKEDGGKTNMEENVQMGNTYYTKYKEITGSDRPAFCFDYPDNWAVTREEVVKDGEGDPYMDYYGEIIELTNDRGVRIVYTQYKISPGVAASGSAYSYVVEYEVEKVNSPVNILSSEELMVGKINERSGGISYALLLRNKAGLQKTDLPGYYDMCSFYYPASDSYKIESPDGVEYAINPYTFIAESPDGKFTEEEEIEVTAILSSFRAAP